MPEIEIYHKVKAMGKWFIPKNYRPLLTTRETEHAIKLLKDFFELNLSAELQLRRVTAPLFVLSGTGLNDDLSGTERAVSFEVKDMGARAEVVHSLAKWKRVTLKEYEVPAGRGIYTDMNAIRADEEMDNLHSIYVDQWDWEQTISEAERTEAYLRRVVEKIFNVMKRTEYFIEEHYPVLRARLPESIKFVHSEELVEMFPGKSAKERELEICKKFGCVFIEGIGGALSNGEPHDRRAPDYDDYTSVGELSNRKGLNGDILVWNELLGIPIELSSMGIRVNESSLLTQLQEQGAQERKSLMYHRMLLNGELPLSIGGGIGQSRLCLHFLQKAHIGETQASIWPDDMRAAFREAGVRI